MGLECVPNVQDISPIAPDWNYHCLNKSSERLLIVSQTIRLVYSRLKMKQTDL